MQSSSRSEDEDEDYNAEEERLLKEEDRRQGQHKGLASWNVTDLFFVLRREWRRRKRKREMKKYGKGGIDTNENQGKSDGPNQREAPGNSGGGSGAGIGGGAGRGAGRGAEGGAGGGGGGSTSEESRARQILAWIDERVNRAQEVTGASRGVFAASTLMTLVFIVTIVFATRYNNMAADIEIHYNDTQASEEIGQ